VARRTFTVPPDLQGLRLDQALTALVPGLSRRGARALIERGAVYLRGRRCRTASKFVLAGANLYIEEDGREAGTQEAPLHILWEGWGVVALDKPAQVPFAPTRSAVQGTLLHALARQVGRPLNQIHPIHRLDTPTSGVVLVALDPGAAAFLSEAIQGGRLRKTYLAWVSGSPSPAEGEWSWPLGDVGPDGRVSTGEAGRPALTRYLLLEQRGTDSLVQAEPVTGRTHQIRAHCALAGCPIVGDRTYGGSLTAPRALLHAWRVAFPSPDGGEDITVEAPLPDDMKREQGAGSR
jgi:23S rRNA pseudouridine1911/1915/1917 synthase